MIYYNEKMRFFDACKCARSVESTNKIGTLHEKYLHSALKFFIEPNIEAHEIRVGRYIADVKNAEGIFEIQTCSFNVLRKKLSVFLEHERVTIVYPIPHLKRLIWINEGTGELSKPRKSPKKGCFFDAFTEIYKLDSLAGHKSLRIMLLLVDMDEYRLLNGWGNGGKKGSARFERIPVELFDKILVEKPTDYIELFPEELPNMFTSKDLAKHAKITLPLAQKTLTVLSKLGVISCIGRLGRLKLYLITRQQESD